MLPLVSLTSTCTVSVVPWESVTVHGIVVCGLVRAAGRRLEPALWASWGGAPTTRRLRFREDNSLLPSRLFRTRNQSHLKKKTSKNQRSAS